MITTTPGMFEDGTEYVNFYRDAEQVGTLYQNDDQQFVYSPVGAKMIDLDTRIDTWTYALTYVEQWIIGR